MSNKEQCVALLDDFTEAQLVNVAAMLKTMRQAIADALDGETPNATTIAALMEGDEMLKKGTGQHFQGSAEEFFAMLDGESDDADD
ncbi:hypothetical protein [Acutalibacter intestini]|uniref:hypothetical protein n=1 Tax=Acutalibacter intestini TaxID=3093659 RepID=UPI002AC8E403|nr:hypothetical protein [Acutalibacter sp. M00204]